MRIKKTILYFLLIILLSVSFGGCQKAEEKPKVIRFGAAQPFTGNLAMEGDKHQKGYDLWAEETNKAGGITVNGEKYLVEIVYYDYQSDTATAVKLAEKLITEDKVDFLLGPMGSGAAKAVSAVTEKYQIPMVAPSASSIEVFTDGYKFIFGIFTENATLAEPLTDLALSKGVKSIAIVSRNDLFPLSIANELITSCEKRGIEVNYFDQYAIGTTDFSAMLIDVAKTSPDWLFMTGYAEDGLQFFRQVKELGISTKMQSMVAGAAFREFVEGLGESSEYVTTACWWHEVVTYEGTDVFKTSKNFVDLFEKKYGFKPDYPHAGAAVSAVVLAQAIEKANSLDPIKVREALATETFETFFAPIKFSEIGIVDSYIPPVMQILDGKHLVLLPEDIKQSEFVYPIPPWDER
ncbi:MAG: Leucine-, isoleucine-, valine-, threonine-, and alanine-binding protein precursor [Bacteroidetes bacterium ADurb.Bin141]|jgi:branched-chain amino acid transport system substrate-binding protein|uniref:Putative branched-chain amino acid transporter substrate-binding protein n=1 Tax=Candidatus Brevifilum fermentans TaxID=1986204 RepID=A0A1Y6K3R4_9CHLR|nr:amino acid ABC transporter substrate-binding protein [Brevefilum fermentans]OQB59935.1 MAG: Leucine-, isoleucine-, valine-, threonine-, and alanine-binding protein precursor [Bacteroidetes bacterium ADurb.Bin141]SMX53497.1 putative branched-chain amino acid transporter substrate-binding protein [Brevefilum fermentans]